MSRFPMARLLLLVGLLVARPGALAADDTDVLMTLSADNTAFAIDMYQMLSETEGNLVYSPYSLSTALAMTLAGARHETAIEMRQALRFSLEQPELDKAMARLQVRLEKLSTEGTTLQVANSLWPHEGFELRSDYSKRIQSQYGASVTSVDYSKPADAAGKINNWTSQHTEGRIKNLIAPDMLNTYTVLVLVNAVYFKGTWESEFDAAATQDAPFFLATGDSIQVPTMRQTAAFRYTKQQDVQIVELPYAGEELSMLILLPKGDLVELERSLTAELLRDWLREAHPTKLQLFLPRFSMSWKKRLEDDLVSMGMQQAFSDNADFSGMHAGADSLSIDFIIQEAFIEVNEEGTEAAAATAVGIAQSSAVFVRSPLRVDHPFLFLIRDVATGSILFMGRVSDPSQGREG